MGVPEYSATLAILCAGAVIHDGAGRLLVVLRRNEPSRGCWSVPGGRVELDESPAAAACREVLEETGLRVQIGALLGVVRQDFVDAAGTPRVLEIHDFAALVLAGVPTAGDDAAAVAWMSLDQLASVPTTPGLLDVMQRFGVPLS